MTLAADRLEARLPGCFSTLCAKTRSLSLPALPAFAAHHFKRDPAFYTSYTLATFCLSNIALPATLLSLGLSAPLVATARALVGTPVDLAVVALRSHAMRADRSHSLWGSITQLVREFLEFGEQRRQENRVLAQQLRLQ